MARTILLADDSVTAQNMGRRILTDAGYEVITVNNGSAALKKIAEQKPDLIVLDVYMPGYGGLEVCHRVKESRETARIPVLLTVGKLEPFKPDEARRVHADAFIVKPFEASELLTALTKLEDKIVPQGQSQKPGRFAKALATIEASEGDERFGDKETGWKDRLIIPSGPAKAQEPEAEVPVVAGSGLSTLGRGDDFAPAEPKQEFERPIPAGLPSDITAEEIAAITAAAAAFGGKVEAPAASEQPALAKAETKTEPAKIETAASEVPSAEVPPVTLATPPAEHIEAVVEAKPLAEVEPAPDAVALQEDTKPAESAAAELPSPAASESKAEPATEAAPAAVEGKAWARDAEVLAAIASLAPSDGDASENGRIPATQATEPEADEVPVAVAAAIASTALVGASPTGPRWLAEAVAVSDAESRLDLEHEMEKAHAAFAAAEGAKAGFAGSSTEIATATAEVVPTEAPAAVVATAGGSASAAELTATPAVEAGASDIGAIAESKFKEEATFAAAASAGSSMESPPPVEETASAGAAPAEPLPSVAETGEKQGEAELAAAWQNWQQIRETIVGAQLTSQIADAAAAELRAGQEAETPEAGQAAAAESAEEENATEGSGEPAAIASIVDSVLAELKPKLLEEIARKMSAEKKGKGKKGKK